MRQEERYTPGYRENAVEFMRARMFEDHGAFFRPYLRPGQRVLDAGCGPGNISAGIARIVAPGEIVCVDADPGQIETTRALFEAEGRVVGGEASPFPSKKTTATLCCASVYELPFKDESFDAVFSNALFEHLLHPGAALVELRRVLKSGGRLGLRIPDWDGFLFAPHDAAVARALLIYRSVQHENGGATSRGRFLHVLARRCGFTNVQPGADYETHFSARRIARYLGTQLAQAREGVAGASRSDLDYAARALYDWGEREDAVLHQAWCSIVARR